MFSLLVHLFIFWMLNYIKVPPVFLEASSEKQTTMITFSEFDVQKTKEIVNKFTEKNSENKSPQKIPTPKLKNDLLSIDDNKDIEESKLEDPILKPENIKSSLEILTPQASPLTTAKKLNNPQYKKSKSNENNIPNKISSLSSSLSGNKITNTDKEKENQTSFQTSAEKVSKDLEEQIDNSIKSTFDLKVSSPINFNSAMKSELSEKSDLSQKNKKKLKKILNCKLSKYKGENNSNYFRLKIEAQNKYYKLQSYNKDIYFLLDISGSITDNDLKAFRQGIKKSLINLNEKDRFDIIAFNNTAESLFGELKFLKETNIRKAKKFLQGLNQGGSTNIFKAITPYLQNSKKQRPVIIYLISDGKTNMGNITKNTKLIKTISEITSDNTSVYTFSNTKEADSFLLKFIAYKNGGKFNYGNSIETISDKISKQIVSLNNILLMDVDYQISSQFTRQAVPKKLPDLSRNNPLYVYGRYKNKTQSISFRISARDKTGSTQEFVYNLKLNKARTAGKHIKKKWAKQYIYHLYSLLISNYSDRLKKEILNISKRYSLKTKYINDYLYELD